MCCVVVRLFFTFVQDEYDGIRVELNPKPKEFPFAKKVPTMNFEQAKAKDEKYGVNTYGTRQMLVHRGSNAKMFDDSAKKEYIDFVAGIAVNVFGHSDPEWSAVVARQAERISHTSNLYYTEEQVKLAEALVKSVWWGWDLGVFFWIFVLIIFIHRSQSVL